MIQPKTYNYINRVEKGDNKVYGFIAQQVKDVIPEAIKLGKENIYKVFDLSGDVITTN